MMQARRMPFVSMKSTNTCPSGLASYQVTHHTMQESPSCTAVLHTSWDVSAAHFSMLLLRFTLIHAGLHMCALRVQRLRALVRSSAEGNSAARDPLGDAAGLGVADAVVGARPLLLSLLFESLGNVPKCPSGINTCSAVRA
eukprot:27543-Chlamydomonas_euryale.AAC.5